MKLTSGTRLALAVACAAAALLVADTAAAASFSAPIPLSAPSATLVQAPAIAITTSGRIVVAWERQRTGGGFGVVVRRSMSAGGFGPAETVAASGLGPAVAAAGGRSTAVAYQEPGPGFTRHLRISVARGHSSFGPPQTLAFAHDVDPSRPWPLALLATGDHYVLVWREGSAELRSDIVYAVSDASGHFGAPRALAAAGTARESTAVSPDGTVTAAWQTPYCACLPESACADCGPYHPGLAYAQLRPTATRFGRARTLTSALRGGGVDHFAVDAGPGGSALAWTESGQPFGGFREASTEILGSTGQLGAIFRGTPPGRVRTEDLAAAHGPAAPVTAATLALPGSRRKQFADSPTIALPAAGAPVAAWSVFSADGSATRLARGIVLAAAQRANGTYAPPERLSLPGAAATEPTAAATRSSAVVVWNTGQAGDYGLAYTVRGRSGAFGPTRALTPGRALAAATLAAAPDAVLAAWISRDPGRRLRVSVAVLRD